MRDPIAVTKEAVVVGASVLVVGSLLMAIDLKVKTTCLPLHHIIGSQPIGFMKPLEPTRVLNQTSKSNL